MTQEQAGTTAAREAVAERVEGPEMRPAELRRQLQIACADPGAHVIRRGMTRDGKQISALEPVPSWQVGAIGHVLRDYLDRLLDSGPATTVPNMDAFIDGWNAAIEHILADVQELS